MPQHFNPETRIQLWSDPHASRQNIERLHCRANSVQELYGLLERVFDDPFVEAAVAFETAPRLGVCLMLMPNCYLRKSLKCARATRADTEHRCTRRIVLTSLARDELHWLAARTLSVDELATRVDRLVRAMEREVIHGQGFRLNILVHKLVSQASRVKSQPADAEIVREHWRGSDFLQALPELNPAWSMVDLQEARVEGFLVSRVVWQGAQECPHQDPRSSIYFGYRFGNQDFVVRNLRSGEQMALSSLTLHMAREHHDFNRGKYTLCVKKLARLLEVTCGRLAEVQD